ncbi:MAG: hypothetical protein R3F37_16870 [Candidatus Competibacteraceae bacterium]
MSISAKPSCGRPLSEVFPAVEKAAYSTHSAGYGARVNRKAWDRYFIAMSNAAAGGIHCINCPTMKWLPFEDVTRRRNAEEALQQAYDNIRTLVTEHTQRLLTEINERRQVETVLRNARSVWRMRSGSPDWEIGNSTSGARNHLFTEIYRLLGVTHAKAP